MRAAPDLGEEGKLAAATASDQTTEAQEGERAGGGGGVDAEHDAGVGASVARGGGQEVAVVFGACAAVVAEVGATEVVGADAGGTAANGDNFAEATESDEAEAVVTVDRPVLDDADGASAGDGHGVDGDAASGASDGRQCADSGVLSEEEEGVVGEGGGRVESEGHAAATEIGRAHV